MIKQKWPAFTCRAKAGHIEQLHVPLLFFREFLDDALHELIHQFRRQTDDLLTAAFALRSRGRRKLLRICGHEGRKVQDVEII